MKTQKTTASRGGDLRRQLDDLIDRVPQKREPQRRMSRRLKCAIEALRRYICSECAIDGGEVKERDIARLALKVDWSWLYNNNFYVGFSTLEELQLWARDIISGRDVATA